MDTDKKGTVDLEEFIKGCFHARGSVSGLDMIFLMSETKSLSKHMQISMNYVEDRFNEILSLCAPGCLSSVATWEQRLDSAGRTDGQRLNSVWTSRLTRVVVVTRSFENWVSVPFLRVSW